MVFEITREIDQFAEFLLDDRQRLKFVEKINNRSCYHSSCYESCFYFDTNCLVLSDYSWLYISSSKSTKTLVTTFGNRVRWRVSTKMNCTLFHPLMLVKNLDEEPLVKRSRKKTVRKKSLSHKPSIREAKHHLPARSLSLNSIRVDLSESDSEKEPIVNHIEHDPSALVVFNFDSDSDDFNPDVPRKLTDEDRRLLQDLRLSSESSSDSDLSSSSNITGDSEGEVGPMAQEIIAPLSDTLKGEGYFWVQTSSNSSPLHHLDKLSLAVDQQVFLNALKICCSNDLSEKAGLMFSGKLKKFRVQTCFQLVQTYFHLMKNQYLVPGVESLKYFGRVVMTLVHHRFQQSLFKAARELIKFLDSHQVDPLTCQPFVEQKTPVKLDTMCCETFLSCNDWQNCVKFLVKSVENNLKLGTPAAIDSLIPLFKKVASELLIKKDTCLLLTLFNRIFDAQEDLESPFDMSVFYDGTLCLLSASLNYNKNKQALALFHKVSQRSYSSPSAFTCRNLLIVSVILRERWALVNRVFCSCVNQNAFPPFKMNDWSIKLRSSMSKIEIQVYIEQRLLLFAQEIQNGSLKPLDTCLYINVEEVGPLRSYVHPVHPILKGVDCSVPAAVHRLYSALFYYMQKPAYSLLRQSCHNQFIMFHSDVEELFRKVLNIPSLKAMATDTKCFFCSR